jgi:hypothetical protein
VITRKIGCRTSAFTDRVVRYVEWLTSVIRGPRGGVSGASGFVG